MAALQHMTIPNSTLRRFLNDKKELFLLDIDTQKIEPINVDLTVETPRVMYNTTKDKVFSEEADEYIKKEVEKPLGDVYVQIMHLIDGTKNIFKKNNLPEGEAIYNHLMDIEKEYGEVTIKAIAIQTARHIEFIQKLGIEYRNVDKKIFTKAVDKYRRLFEKLHFNIAIIRQDCSNSTFVLPPSHCIFYGDSIENLIIFVPLSPNHALALMSQNYYDNSFKNDDHHCIILDNDNSVNVVNHSAFVSATNYEKKHLIGLKTQLEYIKNKELLM